jgi:SAM-dependent methyltransferase
MTSRRDHWDTVYAGKPETAVSWYQPHAERSLQLIRAAPGGRDAAVIDVGGGASTLVDDLLADGYRDVTVLDISESALSRAKARLGARAGDVGWIVADITNWAPPRTWTVWHDRAVFHFLTEKGQQDAYIAALKSATDRGATVIVATFALDGPERCSGLPVQRYDAATLMVRLGNDFRLVSASTERHVTPGGVEQRFAYSVLERR